MPVNIHGLLGFLVKQRKGGFIITIVLPVACACMPGYPKKPII